MNELEEGLAEVHCGFGQILDKISRLLIQDRLVGLDRPSSDGLH